MSNFFENKVKVNTLNNLSAENIQKMVLDQATIVATTVAEVTTEMANLGHEAIALANTGVDEKAIGLDFVAKLNKLRAKLSPYRTYSSAITELYDNIKAIVNMAEDKLARM